MWELRRRINCLLTVLLFCPVPRSFAASPDLKLIALVPPGAQVISGISALPHEPQPDQFVLLTHNNVVDLDDLLAICGADGSRTIQQVVFVAVADMEGELREHSLLVSGHFDQARIYKSARESGAVLTSYRGIPVLEIQPFSREKDSFNHVRWLAVLNSNVLVFGTIATSRWELDRHADGRPPDSSLLDRLARLRGKDQTWTLLSPPASNYEIRGLLSALDPELTEIAQSGRALDFGIYYGRRIEFEYDVAADLAADSGGPPQPPAQSLATSEFTPPLLSSPNAIARGDSSHGHITISMTHYREWLEEIRRYSNQCLLH